LSVKLIIGNPTKSDRPENLSPLCSGCHLSYHYLEQSNVSPGQLSRYSIDDEDLKQIWPTRYAHINVYGRYHFNKEDIGKKRELRALRSLASTP
jgi:hypothetical protein